MTKLLKVGKVYEIRYSKQEPYEFAVIDEYSHHYVCVHKTLFGDSYKFSIAKNSLICAGNVGEMPYPVEKKHS